MPSADRTLADRNAAPFQGDGPRVRGSAVRVMRGGREVVRGVDLTLNAGEIVALLGPNGAGKSTLLAAVAGGVELSGGAMEVDGRVAVAMQAPELARRTALGNVELALGWWGVPRGAERRARALRALETMGVAALAGRRADSLSGGERRRVHIARALAVESDVLLLDEPFAGLDGEARAALLADSASVLRSETRATMIVVHDRAEAWALADRVLVLLDGRLEAEGRPRELLEAPRSAAVARFLGFDGWVRDGDEVLLTRPAGVVLDPGGELVGTVTGVLGMEDGARVMVTLGSGAGGPGGPGDADGPGDAGGPDDAGGPGDADAMGGRGVTGVLSALVPWPAPELGAEVHLRLTGAVRFPASELRSTQ